MSKRFPSWCGRIVPKQFHELRVIFLLFLLLFCLNSLALYYVPWFCFLHIIVIFTDIFLEKLQIVGSIAAAFGHTLTGIVWLLFFEILARLVFISWVFFVLGHFFYVVGPRALRQISNTIGSLPHRSRFSLIFLVDCIAGLNNSILILIQILVLLVRRFNVRNEAKRSLRWLALIDMFLLVVGPDFDGCAPRLDGRLLWQAYHLFLSCRLISVRAKHKILLKSPLFCLFSWLFINHLFRGNKRVVRAHNQILNNLNTNPTNLNKISFKKVILFGILVSY